MSTGQARRLLDAYQAARSRDTRAIVLMGGEDFFSTGIHLNVIEAADDPGAESWRNLEAIDDLVREIVETDDRIVISALAGDVAAGGVALALAADHVVAAQDVVLNPYYGHMGGLYGSEYWTYLLPRRIGAELTVQLTSAPYVPVGAAGAREIGLVDAVFESRPDSPSACAGSPSRSHPIPASARAAPATSARSRWPRTAPRSSPAATAASSAPTAATTRPAAGSSTRASARPRSA